MNKIISFIIISFAFSLFNLTFSQSKTDGYIKNKVIVKLKPEYKNIFDNKLSKSQFSNFCSNLKITKINKLFPDKNFIKTKSNKNIVDLSLIYEINYSKKLDAVTVSNEFSQFDEVEYSVPHYIPKILETPNDPFNITNQYYLSNIKAYAAWDSCKGDSTIIIGISDTGTDFSHEDLIDNIAYNLNDPINGIDDDGDGFIDNFRGWDLGENDNNPQWNENNIAGANSHGINVSGLADATTNNGVGISGVGYKCKYMPIKISNSYGSLTMAYESIVYAADHGCSVINCSWGGLSGNAFGQDIINYATFNKNCLVVAAAGNNGQLTNDVLYPAAYDNVFCVAASNQQDLKWEHSCFGYHVDIIAPGESTYTTFPNNLYSNGWGTSFAAPLVSGAIALLKSYYKNRYNALQLGEILRVTTDFIDTIGTNIQYAGMMGSGRLNIYRALTDTLPPSVRIDSVKFYTNNGNSYFPGDTVKIFANFTNYLTNSKNLYVKINTLSSDVNMVIDSFYIGKLNELSDTNNINNILSLYLQPTISFDKKVEIKFTYYDDSLNYKASEVKYFIANSSYLNVDTNNIATTITGTGNVAYTNDRIAGLGFLYKNQETTLYEGGLIIGSLSENKAMLCNFGYNNFTVSSKPEKINLNPKSDYDVQTSFSDSYSNDKLNVKVIQNNYLWTDTANDDIIFFNYKIINKNSYSLDSIYVGISNDWDINNPSFDKSNFDNSTNLSYAYSIDTVLGFAGVKLLSDEKVHYYAIDNIAGGAGGIDVTDGFSTNEALISLSTNKTVAGEPNGGDVINIISTGPHNILANDTLNVYFAYIAGDSYYNIINNSRNAQNLYDSLLANKIVEHNIAFKELEVYPIPAKNYINISFYNEIKRNISIEVLNEYGNIISKNNYFNLSNGNFIKNIDVSKLKSGAYFLKVISENQFYIKKILITK